MTRPIRHDRKLAVLRLNGSTSEAGRITLRKSIQREFGPAFRVVLLPASVETIEIRESSFA